MDIILTDVIASIFVYIFAIIANVIGSVLGYSFLRLLHIPLDWVMWLIGGYITVTSCLLVVLVLTHQLSFDSDYATSVGSLGFLVSFHAANLWVVRHMYDGTKKGPSAFFPTQVRVLLLFLRKHHVLLGSLTLLAVLSHMSFYVPTLAERGLYKVVTGFVALGVLLLVVVLGFWITVRKTFYKKPIPLVLKNAHTFLGIAFMLSLALHV